MRTRRLVLALAVVVLNAVVVAGALAQGTKSPLIRKLEAPEVVTDATKGA
jgi:hypothetical protein